MRVTAIYANAPAIARAAIAPVISLLDEAIDQAHPSVYRADAAEDDGMFTSDRLQ